MSLAIGSYSDVNIKGGINFKSIQAQFRLKNVNKQGNRLRAQNLPARISQDVSEVGLGIV